jgi:hypothetical protein
MHVVAVITDSDDVRYFLPIFCITDVCVPLDMPLSCLCASSVALCSLYKGVPIYCLCASSVAWCSLHNGVPLPW